MLPTSGVSSPPPPETHYNITYKTEKDWLDKLKPFVEIAGVVILSIYTIYTIKMYCANKESADAAKSAADTAADTLNRSIEQFRIDERAWVEFDSIRIKTIYPPTPEFKAWSFRYELWPKNVGKTVARDVVARVGDIMGGPPSPKDRGIQMFQDGLFKEQGTGNPVTLPIALATVLAPNTVTRAPIMLGGTEPKNGMYHYLIGRIDYNDAFGVAHWMKFCVAIVDASGDIRNCECCNDEDRNPEVPLGKKH
jgi:hypothetical protein